MLKKKINELEESIEGIVINYTLIDAILDGASVTDQKIDGYYDLDSACALTAAWIAIKARHLI